MKKVFLFSTALLFFSLPFHTAVKYIALALFFLSGVFIIIKKKSFKMDLLNLILLGFGIETLISGLLYTNELKRVFYAEKDLWIIISGFLIYRSVYLNKDDILKFIVLPLVISSVVLFFCGLYKYYVLHDYFKYHLFTTINRSAIYATLSFAFILPFIEDTKGNMKYLFLTGLVFIVLTLEFLASRNAMFAAIVILMVYFIYFSKANLKFKFILLFIVLFSFVIVYLSYDWLGIKIDMFTKLPYRWYIWKAGLDSYFETGNYMLGIGTNNFRSIDLTPYITGWFEYVGSGHNLFLEILVENGIIGLLFYITFLIGVILKLKSYKDRNNVFFKIAVLILITHILTAMTETNLMKEHGFLFLSLLGLSIGKLEQKWKK